MLVLVVGPSGAGKDTLLDGARAALAGRADVRFARRVITRPAEAGGEGHEPTTEHDFAARRDAGGFALHWQAHGLSYGIPADIATDLAAGRAVVASVSRAVIAEAALRFPTRVVEITAAAETLARRLAGRGREDAAGIAGRLARDVPIPTCTEITVIRNDGGVAEGVAALVAAITRAAETAPRS